MTKIKEILNKERVDKLSSLNKLESGESVYYDFSKTHITDEEMIIKDLNDKGFINKLTDLYEGKNVNYTENKPVLHYLLRTDNKNLKDKRNLINKELNKMKEFENNFDSLTGITGKKLDMILNIGIGGSDLGPKMVNLALKCYKKRQVYFLSNVDPSNLLMNDSIDLERTLVIVVSKSFTTIETSKNAQFVLNLYKKYNQFNKEDVLKKHFVAVTANECPMIEGVRLTKFDMWDFVGGRYSLWSAVGLSIILGIGFDNFDLLLKGANQADKEFFKQVKTKSIDFNLPSIKIAIIEIFYRKYFKNNEGKLNSGNFNNKCIVPYDCHLEYLYKYLQQAEMESNGKLNSGQLLIWGGIGTDVQHSFFQMLHQNDENVLLEILFPAKNLYTEPENFNKSNVILNQNDHKLYKRNIDSDLNSIQFTKKVKLDDLVEESFNENLSFIKDHHKLLLANGLAQSRALMNGKDNSDEKLLFKGDKPTTTILYSKLTPDVLGYLLSIYEHKIFTIGSYYQVNSFDQFGVQLGKEIAIEIYENKENFDESTKKLLELIEEMNKF